MRSTFTAMALALSVSALASPAAAQYGGSAPPAEPYPAPGAQNAAKSAPAATAAAPAEPMLCPANVTKGARKPLLDLQTAVNAKDAAGFATADAAAHAAAKNADDRCILAQLEMNYAAGRSDYAAAGTALDAIVASGVGNPAQTLVLTDTLGKLRYNAKDYAGAATMFERGIKLAPNDSEQYILLGETRAKTGQTDAALELYRKAIAIQAAAGGKVREDYLKHAVAMAYESKTPQAFGLAREWAAAYPSPKSWRDAIKIYAVITGLPNSELLDMYRLQRATKSLAGEADYARYAQVALDKGLVGEAKAVLDEGIAAKAISATSSAIMTLRGQAMARVAGDRPSLAPATVKALAAPLAKPAMNTADAFFGYGEFAKAAELYRAALTKTGADAGQINLRLGIALTMAGDKAGAKAALDAVTGPKSEIAKYWLTYLAQRP